MSLVTTTNWIVTNLNLVFLNCVLLVVYELKIADAISAGAQGATIKGGPGDSIPENFEIYNLWNAIFHILSHRLQLITQKGQRFIFDIKTRCPSATLHIWYVRPKLCSAVPKNMWP